MNGPARGQGDPLVLALGAACAVWTLIALTHWSDLLKGVTLGAPWGAYNAYLGETLLFASGVQAAPLLAGLVFNLIIAAIGYGLVVAPIWGRRSGSGVLLLLAGVAPGALIVIALTRLITMVAPHAAAPWIIFALSAALAGFALWRRGGALLISFSWRDLGAAAAAIAATLVFQVHFDGFHISGEASLWLIENVFLSESHGLGVGSASLPLISQHYDEAALIYAPAFAFVAPGPEATGALTSLHWLFLAIGRLSMACIVYIALRGLDIDRLSGLILTAFVFAASMSLNPASSNILFDSFNPLAYGLHTARILTCAAPLLIVSALANARTPVPRLAWAVALALGLGAASMPMHAAILIPWALALMALTAINPGACGANLVWRAAGAAALTVLIALTFVYGVQGAPTMVRALTLLAAAALPAAAMAWLAFAAGPRSIDRRESALFLLALAACAGFFLGLALMGNFAIARIAPLLDGVWPWSGLPVLERLERYAVIPAFEIAYSPFCDGVWTWRNHLPASHCSSLPEFVRSYGLVFVAIAAALSWRLAHWRWAGPAPADKARKETLLLWAVALCLFALPVSFFIYDFLAGRSAYHLPLSIWLRSRFVEPWFIGGVLLAAALFLREAGPQPRRWVQGFMLISIALFIFNPLVFAGQWIANVFYLIRTLAL